MEDNKKKDKKRETNKFGVAPIWVDYNNDDSSNDSENADDVFVAKKTGCKKNQAQDKAKGKYADV